MALGARRTVEDLHDILHERTDPRGGFAVLQGFDLQPGSR